jgi:hypothetical protein
MNTSVGQTTVDHTYAWGWNIAGRLLKLLCRLRGVRIVVRTRNVMERSIVVTFPLEQVDNKHIRPGMPSLI